MNLGYPGAILGNGGSLLVSYESFLGITGSKGLEAGISWWKANQRVGSTICGEGDVNKFEIGKEGESPINLVNRDDNSQNPEDREWLKGAVPLEVI